VPAGKAKAASTAENYLAGGLRAEGNGLFGRAMCGKDDVKVTPDTVLHDDRITRKSAINGCAKGRRVGDRSGGAERGTWKQRTTAQKGAAIHSASLAYQA
jgi:hypothetical protein